MTSKEALDHLIEYFKDFEDMPAIMKEELNIISKDLDRLEKLEKAIDILRWCIEIVKDNNNAYVVLAKSHIDKEEYKKLKEWLDDK